MEYDLHEDLHLDGSTMYDSDNSDDSWIPYTGPPYRYYYKRQDLEWQSPPFCHTAEDYWLILSYAPIWLTVLVSLVAIVGFGFVTGFLVAVARSKD